MLHQQQLTWFEIIQELQLTGFLLKLLLAETAVGSGLEVDCVPLLQQLTPLSARHLQRLLELTQVLAVTHGQFLGLLSETVQ